MIAAAFIVIGIVLVLDDSAAGFAAIVFGVLIALGIGV